jgi:hypothetical protein
MKQRFQVDIKPNHQLSVRQLMKKLGDVSGADAIGFLIETQISAALARLDPTFRVTHIATEKPHGATGFTKEQQEVAHYRQTPTVSHATPQNEATDALDALLGA